MAWYCLFISIKTSRKTVLTGFCKQLQHIFFFFFSQKEETPPSLLIPSTVLTCWGLLSGKNYPHGGVPSFLQLHGKGAHSHVVGLCCLLANNIKAVNWVLTPPHSAWVDCNGIQWEKHQSLILSGYHSTLSLKFALLLAEQAQQRIFEGMHTVWYAVDENFSGLWHS